MQNQSPLRATQNKFALCGRTIYPPAMFSAFIHLFAFCWHTGDNVRLSDVVKLYIGFYGSRLRAKARPELAERKDIRKLLQELSLIVLSANILL